MSNSEIVLRAEDLSKRLLSGDRRALSRAISLVESDSEAGKLISAAIYPHTGNAQIVGVTGSAGAGKSTLMSIVYGLYQADSGSISVSGKEIKLKSPRDSIERRI